VFVNDELKPLLLLLLSDTDPLLVCSLGRGEMADPLHASRSGEVMAGCEESPADTLGKESGAFRNEPDGESEDWGLLEINEIPFEDVVATFLKRSNFSCMVIMFDGEVKVTVGILCSEETGALAAEDTGNVKLGVVLLDRDVTGADVTDPESPKFIFAELVLGT
jgi:hypothetical protein